MLWTIHDPVAARIREESDVGLLLLASERTRRHKVPPTRLTSSRSHCDSMELAFALLAPTYQLADKAGPLNVQSCQLHLHAPISKD